MIPDMITVMGVVSIDASLGQKEDKRNRKQPMPDGSATKWIPIESSTKVYVSAMNKKDTKPVNADALAAKYAFGVLEDSTMGLLYSDVENSEVTPIFVNRGNRKKEVRSSQEGII